MTELTQQRPRVISSQEMNDLKIALNPLIGIQIDILSIPDSVLLAFEPSQVGTIVGSLMDASIPVLHEIPGLSGTISDVGLRKAGGILGEREGYPDYIHSSGKRLELKLLFVDNPDIQMKKPPTPREPSARLTQKVTVRNVIPELDVLLVIAYRLEKNRIIPTVNTPTIVDLGLFSVYECILARDKRMIDSGGMWFGDYETPTVLSKLGAEKVNRGIALDRSAYGRKEQEGRDFNEDTNFGKLKRIPFKPLQDFLKKYKIE